VTRLQTKVQVTDGIDVAWRGDPSALIFLSCTQSVKTGGLAVWRHTLDAYVRCIPGCWNGVTERGVVLKGLSPQHLIANRASSRSHSINEFNHIPEMVFLGGRNG
jgi:hypothetical protein